MHHLFSVRTRCCDAFGATCVGLCIYDAIAQYCSTIKGPLVASFSSRCQRTSVIHPPRTCHGPRLRVRRDLTGLSEMA